MSEGISVEDCFVFLKNCAHYHCIMPLFIPDDFLCSELLLCLKLSNSLLSHFSHILLFATLWIVARQAPLSTGFSRQEYCSGLSCLYPGDLPKPGIKPTPPVSPVLQADSLPIKLPGQLCFYWCQHGITFSTKHGFPVDNIQLGLIFHPL